MSTRAELKQATQVEYPWKAAIRTAVQVGIPAFLTIAVVVPLIVQILLEELGERMPDSVRLWLIAAAALITSAATILARVMAIPAVNAWLAKFGLAATPNNEGA